MTFSQFRTILKTLPVLIPVAAIIVANFGGIEWLRLAGILSLAAVVALLVLRARIVYPEDIVSSRDVALALGVALGLFVAAFLPHASLDFLALPLLAGLSAALAYVIGCIVYRLLRLSRDA